MIACCCYCYYCCCCCWFCCVVVVVVNPKNLFLKFGQNWVRNSWDIADIDFLVVHGWWTRIIFMSNPTFELSWGCDNSCHLHCCQSTAWTPSACATTCFSQWEMTLVCPDSTIVSNGILWASNQGKYNIRLLQIVQWFGKKYHRTFHQ